MRHKRERGKRNPAKEEGEEERRDLRIQCELVDPRRVVLPTARAALRRNILELAVFHRLPFVDETVFGNLERTAAV